MDRAKSTYTNFDTSTVQYIFCPAHTIVKNCEMIKCHILEIYIRAVAHVIVYWSVLYNLVLCARPADYLPKVASQLTLPFFNRMKIWALSLSQSTEVLIVLGYFTEASFKASSWRILHFFRQYHFLHRGQSSSSLCVLLPRTWRECVLRRVFAGYTTGPGVLQFVSCIHLYPSPR